MLTNKSGMTMEGNNSNTEITILSLLWKRVGKGSFKIESNHAILYEFFLNQLHLYFHVCDLNQLSLLPQQELSLVHIRAMHMSHQKVSESIMATFHPLERHSVAAVDPAVPVPITIKSNTSFMLFNY